MIQHHHHPSIPMPPLPFSPATQVGDLIFISGQASVNEKGEIVSESFEGEFRRTMENIKRILTVLQIDLSHVVQVKSYVRDPSYLPLYNKLYIEYFKPPYPARTTIVHCLPENLHFEMDCIAAAKK